jgi:predicted RND superfamily exporter protein
MLPMPVVTQSPVSKSDAQALSDAMDRSGKLSEQWISKDRKLGLMILNLNQDIQKIEELSKLVHEIKLTLAKQNLPPTMNYSLAGLPAIRSDVVESLKNDQTTIIPMAGLLFLTLLTFIFRKPVGIILPLASVGVGIVWSMAVYVLMDQAITVVSNALPILLMIIGISNGVHIVGRYTEESRLDPAQKKEAADRTMKHMILACGLTILTTAIGFASLLAARSELLTSMGWQSVSGLALLYLSMVLLFSLFLANFEAPNQPKKQTPVAIFVRFIGQHVVQYRFAWFALALSCVAAGLWSASSVQINSGFMETYTEDHPMMQTLTTIDEKLGGFLRLEVWVRAKEGDLLTPENFERMHKFQELADAHPAILSSFSYVDIHQHLLNESGQFKETPPLPSKDAKGLSQLKVVRSTVDLLHEVFLPYNFITRDQSQARILLRMSDLGTRESLKVIADLERTIENVFPEDSNTEVSLIGEVFINSVAVDRFIRDLSYSFFGAALVIFAIIALLFRSILFGLVAVLPNMTPLILTMGYMGVKGYDLNAGNVVVFSLSLGIAVDNTIHFLARFREEIQHHTIHDALRRTVEFTGRAIVLSSLITISGLAVLTLSEFAPTRHFAELTGFTMLSALVGDLILLPATLAVCWPEKKQATLPTAEHRP